MDGAQGFVLGSRQSAGRDRRVPAGGSQPDGLPHGQGNFRSRPNAEKYTVRMGGCHSCPIRCHSHLDVPSVEEKYGVSRYAASTCVGWGGRRFFRSFPDGARGHASIEAAVVGKHLADDLGVWTHYSQLQRDFQYAHEHGLIKANLPDREYQSIPWAKYEQGDPGFLREIYTRIAFKQGELGIALGEGSGRLAERWKFPQEYYKDPASNWWKMGHPKHHSSEEAGQTGVLINMMYNGSANAILTPIFSAMAFRSEFSRNLRRSSGARCCG